MRTLPFARGYIKFDRASLISGPWNDDRYPHMRKPLAANDNPETQCCVYYKSAGAMGTVLLQIIIAHHIRCSVGDAYFVAQTDEDAETWSTERGEGFILSIPDIKRLERYSMSERERITKKKWCLRNCTLYITGPSKKNRQSRQVRLVATDESHLTDAYEMGALKEFDDRRQRWGWAGRSVHATTAADAGAEVDVLYYLGPQWEYHWRCPECDKLIWPLWREITPTQKHAQEVYGKDVFLWEEKPTEDETLDTIRARCPHCEHVFGDTQKERESLVGEDYVAMNPNPRQGHDSYRWNVFAIADLSWRQTFAKYREAIAAAKLGNYTLLENFAKKQLCASWFPPLLDFGNTQLSDYKVGEVWVVEENKLRVCTFDFQEGKGAEGVHWWGQVDEYLRNGNSRRVDFKRLESWADCRAFQLTHNVLSGDTYCDAGHRDKEVFKQCADFGWYALVSSDDDEFHHSVKQGQKMILVPNPYFTQKQWQDSMAGQGSSRWCISRTWSKPNIGFLLLRLKDGRCGLEYGIPKDILAEYPKQLNSYTEVIDIVKKTGRRGRILRQLSDDDHSFATSSQCLLGAIIKNFFPVAGKTELEKQTA